MLYQAQSTIKKQIQKGFTLIEVLVTIAIVAVISAIALPNLDEFMVKMRVDGQIAELQRLLLTARNTAINTGKDTTICPLSAANVCTNSTDWTGTIGVVNEDGVIKEKPGIESVDTLIFDHKSIVFTATGQTSGNSSGTFKFCPSGNPDLNRGIDVSLSGRVYSTTDTDSDGKDESRSGGEISCS